MHPTHKAVWPPAHASVARGPATFNGFLRVENARIVDGDGNPLLLRGVGLGNWHLPEGYMWGLFGDAPSSPRAIEALVEDLVGTERARQFWNRYRSEFITATDVRWIAGAGFDHIRLPLNSRYMLDADGNLLPDAFDIADRLITWARDAGLWVIIDLHGAPGGQTGTNIDDSPNNRPELFENDEYRRQCVYLWTEIARRYVHETVVAGYDLLNEPLPNEWQYLYADRLVSLYKELTTAIRAVDTNHVLIYEGAHWATNWSIFTEVWDPQSVLQFHKYWSEPDRPSIQRFLHTGSELGLPIYMGEGGENNPDWLATAFGMYADLGISWNFWTWKKIDTNTSPLSIDPPTGWQQILDYGHGIGARPAADDAWSSLLAALDAMAPERCTAHPEIITALLRRLPASRPAIAYGFRDGDFAFHTPASHSALRSDEGAPITYNHDGVADFSLDNRMAGEERHFSVALTNGDYVSYRVELPEATTVHVSVAGTGKRPVLHHDDDPLTPTGDEEWTWEAKLPAGVNTIRVAAVGATDLLGIDMAAVS